MTDYFLIASSSAKAWYLVPLLVSISLVYGGTRHEKPSEILAHSVRSAIWLLVFLFIVFSFVWLSGFGVEAEAFLPTQVNLTLAILGWLFAAFWISGYAFKSSNALGLACLATGGLYALVFGIQHRRHLYFPVAVMCLALIWGIFSLLGSI
jgi:hypothetical protein